MMKTVLSNLIGFVDEMSLFHVFINNLGVRAAANKFLAAFPLIRTLKETGIQYRITSLDAFIVEKEIFTDGIYEAVFQDNCQSFLDLGSNNGFFTAWILNHSRNRQMRGIMVDANKAVLKECQWFIGHNSLANIHAAFGAIAQPGLSEVDFSVCSSSIVSAIGSDVKPRSGQELRFHMERVPTVDLESIWIEKFGDIRCGILKADIEGAEAWLPQGQSRFLQRTDRVIVAWHTFNKTSESDFVIAMQELGFRTSPMLERPTGAQEKVYLFTRS